MDDHVGRRLENQGTGGSIRDDLLQILPDDGLVDGDDRPGLFRCEHLAVKTISYPFPAPRP
jgi:hypothetical protein